MSCTGPNTLLNTSNIYKESALCASSRGPGWPEVTVEEIKAPMANALATGPFGSAISSRHFMTAGIPVIRGGNLSAAVDVRLSDEGLVFVSEEKAKEFKRSIVRNGDLIFTCWGTIDQVGLIDRRCRYPEYVISNKQMKFTPNGNRANSLFLYYLFSSSQVRDQIVNSGIGSSVPGFNLGQLRSMRILLPPLPEQEAIAALLGSMDDRIVSLQQTNETLEATARAIFKSWFVDFDPVRAKAEGREPEGMDAATAALFPSEFQDSELGPVPQGWNVTSISTFGRVQKGLSYKGSGLTDDGFPMINLGCFAKGGNFLRSKIKSYAGEYKTRHLVQAGDIVIANTDITQKREVLGAACLVPDDLAAALFTHHVFCLRLEKHSLALAQYILGNLNQNAFRERAIGFASGTTVLALPPSAVNDFEIAFPGDPLLRAYDDLVRPMLDRVHIGQKNIDTLSALRDTLLPRLISGKLRVPAAEAMLAEAL